MEAMLQKNPHLFWSFIVPWDSRICQLRQRATSKSHGLLEASGTPVWIRTSGLQRRSYQAVKLEALRRKGSVEIAQISAILKKSHRILVGQGSGGFRDSSQIVVWIKCGFSSPVQLNIFTLYPWIRSAASHPSTLARSSTIPACAFASSYCFCS